MTKSDAVWVMVRGFGLFFAYRSIELILDGLATATSVTVYAAKYQAQSSYDSNPMWEYLMPLAFTAGKLACFVIIARYLLSDGAMVHRWCTAAWDRESDDEGRASEGSA